jgi:predicted Zn-dependent protease
MSMIDNLENLLRQGRDDKALRLTLGNHYLAENDPDTAIAHLQAALDFDAKYSAAWKVYGRALAAAERTEEAKTAFRRGIEAAQSAGDVQAAKEMAVFLRRLERSR